MEWEAISVGFKQSSSTVTITFYKDRCASLETEDDLSSLLRLSKWGNPRAVCGSLWEWKHSSTSPIYRVRELNCMLPA